MDVIGFPLLLTLGKIYIPVSLAIEVSRCDA